MRSRANDGVEESLQGQAAAYKRVDVGAKRMDADAERSRGSRENDRSCGRTKDGVSGLRHVDKESNWDCAPRTTYCIMQR